MNLEYIAQQINELKGDSPVLYLHCDAEIADFTAKPEFKVILSSKTSTLTFTIEKRQYRELLGLFKIMEKQGIFDSTLICWDIKNILSLLRFNFSYTYPFKNLIDLKCAEAYIGLYGRMPKTFQEALVRATKVCKNPDWIKINEALYVPLLTQVLPHLETRGIICEGRIKDNYVHYDAVGHKNGRLRCSQISDRYINAHTLNEELRTSIKPKGDHTFFVEIDFNHMEVNVLQWLSQDEELLKIITSGEDAFTKIYEIVFGEKCDTPECRTKIKRIFLPYYFGLQPAGMVGESCKSVEEAKILLDRIKAKFPVSCDWIEQKQYENPIKDYFGRTRDSSDEAPYKRRNFYIQSAAATICLLKLSQVYDALSEFLLFSVHDAYIFSCNISDSKYLIKKAKEELEKPLDMCPGLHLASTCKVGNSLASLKKFSMQA